MQRGLATMNPSSGRDTDRVAEVLINLIVLSGALNETY
jgi:hypothetical protein